MTITAEKPPTSKERGKCWKARDEYFLCLDQNGLWLQGLKPADYEEILGIDPLNIKLVDKTKLTKDLYICERFKNAFDDACLASWISHFSMLRVKDLQTEALKAKMENESAKQHNDDFWKKVQS